VSVHTIYVPPGWSIEQVWETIRRGERVPVIPGGYWVNVDERGSVVA